jgi:hypothetical protein
LALLLATLPALAQARRTSTPTWLVDPRDRQAALDFYTAQYVMASPPSLDWTGDYDSCAAGTINPDYQAATLRRINYYRAMAGLAPSYSMQHTAPRRNSRR